MKIIKKRSNLFLLLMPCIIIFLLLCLSYLSQISVCKITSPHEINLPEPLKQRLLTDPESELMYINYKDRELHYFFISQNSVRAQIVLNTLRKILVSLRYSIPHGYYLLSLHDAAPHQYEVPVLAFATTPDMLEKKSVVLMPDPFALKGYNEIFLSLSTSFYKYPWQKKISKIFFRGSAYGVGSENNDLNGFPRLRFLNYVNNLEFVDAGFTSYTMQLNPKFRSNLALLHPLKPQVSEKDSLRYKYLIDIDGNTCSFSRMAWILYSNSVLLKHASNQVQWYYNKLLPNEHYLLINEDFSNLEDVFSWAELNPETVKQIATNGHRLARNIFSRQSILQSTAEAFAKYHALTQ